MILLTNPSKRRKKRRGTKSKRRWSRSSRLKRARTIRHRRALTAGTAARRAVSALVCGPKPYAKVRRLRSRCGVRSPLASAVSSFVRPTGSLGYGGFRTNPGGIVGSATQAFLPSNLMGALPIAAGVLANEWLTRKVSAYVPAQWQSGWQNTVLSLAVAGPTLMIPKYGSRLFVGGLVRNLIVTLVPWIDQMLAPRTPAPRPVARTASGLGDSTWDESYANSLIGVGDDEEDGSEMAGVGQEDEDQLF